jgi:hypothetical protein
MLEPIEEPMPRTGAYSVTTDLGEGHKIRNRWQTPPSDRANRDVTRTNLPLAALKWIAVVLGVLGMLVVAPLVDVVRSSVSGLRRLLWAVAAPYRR